MLKRSGLFFVFSVIIINVMAQVAAPKKMQQPTADSLKTFSNPNAADFKFEVEEHNFGNVPEGPEVKYDFVFTNTGKEPLVIVMYMQAVVAQRLFGLVNQFCLALKTKLLLYIIQKEDLVHLINRLLLNQMQKR